jgi:hypothetical protein
MTGNTTFPTLLLPSFVFVCLLLVAPLLIGVVSSSSSRPKQAKTVAVGDDLYYSIPFKNCSEQHFSCLRK